MALAWHLAQVNIALMKAPLESPEMADFVAQLEPVNALADSSPGFIWRLQTDSMETPRPSVPSAMTG